MVGTTILHEEHHGAVVYVDTSSDAVEDVAYGIPDHNTSAEELTSSDSVVTVSITHVPRRGRTTQRVAASKRRHMRLCRSEVRENILRKWSDYMDRSTHQRSRTSLSRHSAKLDTLWIMSFNEPAECPTQLSQASELQDRERVCSTVKKSMGLQLDVSDQSEEESNLCKQMIQTLQTRSQRGFLPGGMQQSASSSTAPEPALMLYPTAEKLTHGHQPQAMPSSLAITPRWRNVGVDVIRCSISTNDLRITVNTLVLLYDKHRPFTRFLRGGAATPNLAFATSHA